MNKKFRLFIFLYVGISLAIPIINLEKKTPNDPEYLQFTSIVTVDVYRPRGSELNHIYHHESYNVLTNIGLHTIQRLIAGKGTTQWRIVEGGNDLYYFVDEPNDIALSIDDTGADAIHSSWQAVDGSYPTNIEIVDGGLSRQKANLTAAIAYTPGSGTNKGSITFSWSQVFTVESGYSFVGVQKAGLFSGPYNENDGSNSGITARISPLIAENTFDPVDLNAGDSISVTWTLTI
jgi:hypothetical protein